MNQNSYDKVAQKWASDRNQSFVSRLVKDFAGNIQLKGEVLDIGCGFGYLTRYLCKQGLQVTGIDSSHKMIEMATAQNIANATFLVCDFFDFRSAKKFDGIIAWDSFFHFPKTRQGEIYSKVGNLLKPGGFLLFTHGNADDEHTDKMYGETFYYSCIPKSEVSRALEDNGIEIAYMYTDFIEQASDRALVVLAKKK